MSARSVADLLAVAREGYVAARASGDERLRRDSLRVAARAMEHPDSGAFFGGLCLALSETDGLGVSEDVEGNDPSIEDDGDVEQSPDVPDEDSPSASPAYEGIVNHDGDDRLDDGSEGRPKSPDVNNHRVLSSFERAAANWTRLNSLRVREVKP